LNSGYYKINDIRRFEDLEPIDDPTADTSECRLANVNVEAADLSAMAQKVEMAQRLIQVGFDPADVMASLSYLTSSHTGKDSVQLQAEEAVVLEQNVYSVGTAATTVVAPTTRLCSLYSEEPRARQHTW
jgi:hypothetical protein